MSFDDVSLDDAAYDDIELPDAKNATAALVKLTGRFFKKVSLNCFCTNNRAVVKLLNFVRVHTAAARKFVRKLKKLVAKVKNQRSKSRIGKFA